jgi:hypothetical protein
MSDADCLSPGWHDFEHPHDNHGILFWAEKCREEENMTSPDPNTLLILLFNTIGWVIVWFRKSGVISWQHKIMWAEYKATKKIKENGEVSNGV